MSRAVSEQEVIDAATEFAEGDRERAVRWYETQRIRPLGNLTPRELVAQGKGEMVLSYILSLNAGTG